MYKSPINILYGQMQRTFENDVLKVVQDVGINVDKEELIRALKYDRDQYSLGYEDGKKDAVVHGRWVEAEDGDGAVCSTCGEDFCNIYLEVERFNYCPNCGAHMDLEVE